MFESNIKETKTEGFSLMVSCESTRCSVLVLQSSTRIFRGREQRGVEFGSAERAERVLGEPGVGAFHMEGVVATGNQSSGLVGGDVVEADGAFGAHEKVFSGDRGEVLELCRGEAGVGEWLRR